jgi:hypothetical protein
MTDNGYAKTRDARLRGFLRRGKLNRYPEASKC